MINRYFWTSLLLAVMLGSSVGCASQVRHEELSQAAKLVNNEQLYRNKVLGVWQGKLIGLIAGQPTEGWGREEIERKARAIGFYPITGYMPNNFDSPLKNFLLGNFNGSPSNDDSDLMLTSLLALRDHGIGLTDRQLAESWLKYVPGACTAELVALRNFQQGVWPPESARRGNPYQEMIGAQMRGEIWGMIAAGRPELAARYAGLDASLTHTGNGIYGEQFIAAAVSLAFIEQDREKIIERALAMIPADCSYAEAIRDAQRWHREYPEWRGAWDQLDKKWGFLKNGQRDAPFADPAYNINKDPYLWRDVKWVYVDVNGAAVALTLLYGDGDFSKSVCLAVMIGYDNDCNAGTVGAILGAMTGEAGIPACWKEPLQDQYQTTLNLPDKKLSIRTIAKETADYGLKLAAQITADDDLRSAVRSDGAGGVFHLPIKIELGPEELVMETPRDSVEPIDGLDQSPRAFRDVRGNVQFICGHYILYRSIGPDLNHLKRDASAPVWKSHEQPDLQKHDNLQWIAATYTEDGQTIHALVHNEYHGNRVGNYTDKADPEANAWYNSITYAVSTNGGQTYTRPEPPGHLVLTPSIDYDPDRCQGAYGYFEPSNIIRKDDYYYVFVQMESHGAQVWGTGLLRTNDLANPKSWTAWDGQRFAPIDPVTGRPTCPLKPIGEGKLGKLHHSVTWNDYLKAYIMVGLHEANGKQGVFYTLSDDLIHWTDPEVLMEMTHTWRAQIGQMTGIYPGLLQPDDTTRNFERTAREPYLYYITWKMGDDFTIRKLLRRKILFTIGEAPDGLGRPPVIISLLR